MFSGRRPKLPRMMFARFVLDAMASARIIDCPTPSPTSQVSSAESSPVK